MSLPRGTWQQRRLVDQMTDAYVDWREACVEVSIAYLAWTSAPIGQAGQTFAAYTAALDAEQYACSRYEGLVRRVGLELKTRREPAMSIARSVERDDNRSRAAGGGGGRSTAKGTERMQGDLEVRHHRGMSMARRIGVYLGVALAVTSALAGGAVAAERTAATLRGPAQLHVLQKLTFRAWALPAGTFALRIEGPPGGAVCAATLAGARHAHGTEQFHGSVPDTLHCVRGARRFTAPMHAGRYRAVVRDRAGTGKIAASAPLRII
jgi:hypothetical protein